MNGGLIALPLAELEAVCALFDQAVAYRAVHGGGYASYDRATLAADLAAGRLFGMMLDGRLAQIATVLDADPAIWRAREDGRALYLHRVVTAEWARGQRLFARLVEWAEGEVRARGRTLLRLDTWRAAAGLQDYYAGLGFAVVGEVVIGDDPALAPQYRDLALTLMEKVVVAEGGR